MPTISLVTVNEYYHRIVRDGGDENVLVLDKPTESNDGLCEGSYKADAYSCEGFSGLIQRHT